ncbi:hypothetical protein U9M48_003447 [Paspalum notatum var. saurae]|uniref:Uncharacterized protein n=1 Tax=Paspalum notatum var. saurae TaxID=547442 RepID=A0AAQ3SJW7_PASNO
MPYYETWTFHGEKETRVEVEGETDDASAGVDRMDEMLEALQPEFGLNSEDPPTKEVEEFFKLLKASEEPLHEHTKVSVLAFVTRLIAIKSKYFFSNNYFNDLLQLIGDVLPQPHKLPKDMYHCKRLTKSLGMGYEKLDMYPDSCMIFWGDHKDEKKCLSCGKGRYVEVVNEDGEKVTADIAHKQLCSFPLAPRFKWLLLSHKTTEQMRYTDGVRDNPAVMAHPADSDAWKALDEFDPEFAKDARNIRFGLATDGFIPFIESAASYSCWPVFAIPYNLPPSIEFEKQNWTSKKQPTSKQLEKMRRDGIDGKLNFLDWFKMNRRIKQVAKGLRLFQGTSSSGSRCEVLLRQVQRGSSSQSSGGSSSRQRRTTSDMEMESLRQKIQKRDALKAQEEYWRQQQAHQEYVSAQQMAAIQSMFQQQGLTFVMPEVRPPPVPPQWGMFAQMPFFLTAQRSRVQASNPYQTPPLGSGQHDSEHDFVNNLFAFGGSGHNSNEPGDM